MMDRSTGGQLISAPVGLGLGSTGFLQTVVVQCQVLARTRRQNTHSVDVSVPNPEHLASATARRPE